VSGVPYPITSAAGDETPGSLDQFVGDTSFTIQMRGFHVVHGYGAFDGKSVRFYEKDNNGVGKDIRVWRITAPSGSDSGGKFLACHEAAW
jgi:hypothetical protein